MSYENPHPHPDYGGMTVNERLYSAGLFDAIDEAVRNRDRAGIVEVLSQVDLASQAERIADMILAEPSGYGF
jgi:hypothetical protein